MNDKLSYDAMISYAVEEGDKDLAKYIYDFQKIQIENTCFLEYIFSNQTSPRRFSNTDSEGSFVLSQSEPKPSH